MEWVGGRADSLFPAPLAKAKQERSVLSQQGIYSPTIPSCTCPCALSLQEYIIFTCFTFHIITSVMNNTFVLCCLGKCGILEALNKTVKFYLQKDDYDRFGPSRQIAAQIFTTTCQTNTYFCGWKENEEILFSSSRVVGSYTDRLLSSWIRDSSITMKAQKVTPWRLELTIAPKEIENNAYVNFGGTT